MTLHLPDQNAMTLNRCASSAWACYIHNRETEHIRRALELHTYRGSSGTPYVEGCHGQGESALRFGLAMPHPQHGNCTHTAVPPEPHTCRGATVKPVRLGRAVKPTRTAPRSGTVLSQPNGQAQLHSQSPWPWLAENESVNPIRFPGAQPLAFCWPESPASRALDGFFSLFPGACALEARFAPGYGSVAPFRGSKRPCLTAYAILCVVSPRSGRPSRSRG